MRLTRAALVAEIGWFRSAVARYRSLLPSSPLTTSSGVRNGALLTWLIAPPVEPRPNSTADGPLRTSTESRSKLSRV